MRRKFAKSFKNTPKNFGVFAEIHIFVVGFNPAAFFVNANMVRIPEPLVVVFFISVSYPNSGQQNR